MRIQRGSLGEAHGDRLTRVAQALPHAVARAALGKGAMHSENETRLKLVAEHNGPLNATRTH